MTRQAIVSHLLSFMIFEQHHVLSHCNSTIGQLLHGSGLEYSYQHILASLTLRQHGELPLASRAEAWSQSTCSADYTLLIYIYLFIISILIIHYLFIP